MQTLTLGVSIMLEIFDRVLGFMPQRAVFWSALGTFLIAIMIQYLANWFESMTVLPWMREENQNNRKKIQQEAEKSKQS
jgi:uncharacterized membrane protein required for colicin V production